MKTIQCNFENVKKSDVTRIISKMKASKCVHTLVLFALSTVSLFAQDTSGLNSQLVTWGQQIQNTLNIAVGVFAIVGGFIVFIQYMQGNEQAQRNFIRFVIGLAIFGLVILIAGVFIPDVNQLQN